MEPKNEEILRLFLQTTDDVPLSAPHIPKKKKVSKEVCDQQKDTRNFFANAAGENVSKGPSSNKNNNDKDTVITID